MTMTKDEALRVFGEIETRKGRADAITALTDHLGITRQSFYMWPEDKPIPELRALQVERYAAAKAANEQLARTKQAIEQGGHPNP
jgi:hypothetical protein